MDGAGALDRADAVGGAHTADCNGAAARRARPGPSRRSLAPEVMTARARLDLDDLIILALRAERRRLGLSQRGLAELVGVSSSAIGRLETAPGSTSLDRVLDVLRMTGLDLVLVRRSPGDDTDQTDTDQTDAETGPKPVTRGEWSAADLFARDLRGRRYPGHGTTSRSDRPPRWLPPNDGGWDPRWIWWVWRRPSP